MKDALGKPLAVDVDVVVAAAGKGVRLLCANHKLQLCCLYNLFRSVICFAFSFFIFFLAQFVAQFLVWNGQSWWLEQLRSI